MAEDAEMDARVAARYRLLVEMLGKRKGYRRGWVGETAEELGISPSYVTKIKNGTRPMGVAAALRACARLNLERAWFFQKAEPERIEDFLQSTTKPMGWDAIHRRARQHLVALAKGEDVTQAEALNLLMGAREAALHLVQVCDAAIRATVAAQRAIETEEADRLWAEAKDHAFDALTALAKSGGGGELTKGS